MKNWQNEEWNPGYNYNTKIFIINYLLVIQYYGNILLCY
jgi:hypothetical protein